MELRGLEPLTPTLPERVSPMWPELQHPDLRRRDSCFLRFPAAPWDRLSYLARIWHENVARHAGAIGIPSVWMCRWGLAFADDRCRVWANRCAVAVIGQVVVAVGVLRLLMMSWKDRSRSFWGFLGSGAVWVVVWWRIG